MALAGQGHSVLVEAAQRVDFAGPDQPRRLLDSLGGQPVGRAPLVGRRPTPTATTSGRSASRRRRSPRVPRAARRAAERPTIENPNETPRAASLHGERFTARDECLLAATGFAGRPETASATRREGVAFRAHRVARWHCGPVRAPGSLSVRTAVRFADARDHSPRRAEASRLTGHRRLASFDQA